VQRENGTSELYFLVMKLQCRIEAIEGMTKSHRSQSLLERWSWWLRPVLLATWEAEIRRIMVRDQPGQIVRKTPFLK
jgi:hypothetical protein